MKTTIRLALFCPIAVLLAPLALRGTPNEAMVRELGLAGFVEPVFPAGLRYEGIAEGQVTLAVSRTSTGEPGDVLVLDASHPLLADAAVEAVRGWRFTPEAGAPALPPRIFRIGFKQEGYVMVFPLADNTVKPTPAVKDPAKLAEPVMVPRLENLAKVPRALNQPMPAYPATLAARGPAGRATVRFFVDGEGRVRLPQVINATSPEFADAAMAAVVRWRYEPPQAGGHTIVACDHWEFQFRAAN